jgi:hypothetical protein
MTVWALRLDPEALTNPDADLRYLVPEALAGGSDGALREDAYDYEPETGAMLLWFLSDAPDALTRIVAFLHTARPMGNDLRPAASVWTQDGSALRCVWRPSDTAPAAQ